VKGMTVIRSLNTADKAMQVLQVKIDALANNLANADATGFRQVLTRVSSSGANSPDAGAAPTPGANAGAMPAASRMEMSAALDTRPGPIRETGRDTDFALMGRGFFVVDSESGERYTRNGSFSLDESRQLITPDGLPVMGEGGPLIIEGEQFSLEPDGTIVSGGHVVGRLKIVDFDDPYRLEHQGASLLRAPEDMAAQAVPQPEVTVAQSHLENSNVNPIDTLVAMISAQRAFEVQAKIMTTEDDMLSKAVNNLPRATG